MSEPQAWSWSSEDAKDCMVFPTTHAVAVYQNAADRIVIRQEASMNGEDDSFVVIPREHVPALIAALQAELANTED